MSATLVLASKPIRDRAIAWINSAPANTRIEFKAPRRSLPQNDRMWAMLTDVARQQSYHGMKLSADDWKLIFMDALSHELRIVPNLSGTGFVNLGRSSSKLSKSEMCDLQTLIEAYCAEHGIVLSDTKHEAA